jgi:hypothetical protein
MRRRTPIIVCTALAALAILLGGLTTVVARQDDEATASVSGQVTDKDGVPIENATVSIDNDWLVVYWARPHDNVFRLEEGYYLYRFVSDDALQTTTDENGEFSFSDLVPGHYLTAASADGFQSTYKTVYVEGDTIIDDPLDLEPDTGDCEFPEGDAATFTGTIKDDDTGDPIPGASIFVTPCITLLMLGQDTYSWPPYDGLFTFADEEGQYSIDLVPDDYMVFVGAPGYQSHFFELVPFELAEDMDFVDFGIQVEEDYLPPTPTPTGPPPPKE